MWSIIAGGLIGLVAGRITKKGSPMGIVANVGQSLLGSWGPSIAGMALIPSIAGAAIVVTVVSFFTGKK